MKIKQTIILVIAFVLPIGIFIFLKTLGKNEFEVQPLHQEGVMQVSTECGIEYKTPYRVSQPVLADLTWSEKDSLTLYVFDTPGIEESAISEKLKAYQGEGELQVHKITSDSAVYEMSEDKNPIVKDVVSIEQLRECFFVMEEKKNAVVVDKHQRIRGYYDLTTREELDRLAVEIKIMLKKY